MGELPKARNGLRATTVDNIIYLLGKYHSKALVNSLPFCQGGDTEIMKFDPSANNTWTPFAEMTKKAGSKLEVSTICRYVHNYWDEDAIKYFD